MRLRLVPCCLVVAVMLAIGGRASADDSAPTFNKDVAPILFQNCSSCHRPDEVGPFSLLTYEDARKRAKQIVRVTEKKSMPPWKPSVGHDVFKDARTITDKQISVLKAWADAGSPEGEAKDLPPRPKFPEGWHLGEPDVILKVAKHGAAGGGIGGGGGHLRARPTRHRAVA